MSTSGTVSELRRASTGAGAPAASAIRRPPFRWSDLWRAPLHDFPIRDELIFQFLPLREEWDVLEIGPGAGYTAFWLARRVRKVSLLEVAEEAVSELRCALGALKNVDFFLGDLSRTGLKGALARSFDAIYGLDVFEYVADPAVCLENLCSILRPGGCLFLSFPNMTPPRGDGVSWFSDTSELEELLRGAGFRSWEVFAVRMKPYAKGVYAVGHEWPLRLYRRLRKGDRGARPQTYEATWAFQNRKSWARYRWVVHLWWAALAKVIQAGGPVFGIDTTSQGLLGCQLVVRAWR